jgi:ABC-type lipoprotein release transport system permease subunit
MALGATPRHIALLVLRHGALLAAVGISAGLAGAIVVTRVMQALLFGVDAADAATYAAVVALVLTTALAASYVPARRAARLDPVRTLR